MEFDSGQPIYLQIVDLFKKRIASGQLKPGGKVDAVRDISADLSVNPNTVQKAFAAMEQQNLMYTERTSGRYVTRDAELIQKLRTELMAERTGQYLAFLQELGYRREDAPKLLQTYLEGEN